MSLDILHSKEDASVNFIESGNFPGFTEARYVRRSSDYFIVYLSAQTGCVQACRFCHLTITGQTKLIDVPVDGIIKQAKDVLSLYDSRKETAKIVHFSFMARGEPLSSSVFHNSGADLMLRLTKEATDRELLPRIMVSTIMPQEMHGKSLAKMFPVVQPNIYYSIYSLDPVFRKKWMPKALPVEESLEILKEYQDISHKIIRLHWAFIKDENDSPESVMAIIDAVNKIGLRVDVNIVRYNPFSEKYGEESSYDNILGLEQLLINGLPLAKIKIVNRVGVDVKASCGMFVEK